MEKIVYLLWGDGSPEGGETLRDALLAETVPVITGCGGHCTAVSVHDVDAAEAPSPVPVPEGEDPHIAAVSVWLNSYDDRQGCDEAVAALGLGFGAYLVTESLVEDYGTTPHAEPRTWPAGTRSPGVLTVSLIHRPEGLAYPSWIARWHGVQSPLSASLQPRCRYVRNEVVHPLTGSSPPIDGIVEEAWPSAAHVADPMLFFSAESPEELERNVTAMLDSVNACLDLARLRNTTMSEYLLTDPSPTGR